MPDQEEGDFTGADIIGLPEPEVFIETKTFEFNGRKWTFTVSKEALVYAETFYRMAQVQADAAMQENPEVIMLPGGKKLEIMPGQYLGHLRNLSTMLVKPKLSFTELAIMGHKIGSMNMKEVINWSHATGKTTKDDVEGEVAEAKNDSSAAASS